MFFGATPAFDEMIGAAARFEAVFNATAQKGPERGLGEGRAGKVMFGILSSCFYGFRIVVTFNNQRF